jgi:hypothetical protein
VGKKSIEDINTEADDFIQYLFSNINIEAKRFIEEVNKTSDTYIFSGVIRDYFLKYKGVIRDLDIVFKSIDNSKLNEILHQYNHRKNSFGGYKIEIGDLNIDFWSVDNTWGLNFSSYLDLDRYQYLPKTSFFNFSSIIFDLKKRVFIASPDFLKFLETREIDYVLEENPQPVLCMINTIYYYRKYNLKVSKKLKLYYVKRFKKYSENDYNEAQLKHFNEVLFSYQLLKVYYEVFDK